ncbi:MAG: DUF938 domain-containing protein [Aestuariivirgaceae bacterium]
MNSKRLTGDNRKVPQSSAEPRLDAPAFHRNKEAILNVLRDQIRTLHANMLEIASGTGQHAAHFAERWPQATWWPSDLDPKHIDSINAWARHTGAANIRTASLVDVTAAAWLSGDTIDRWPAIFDAILAANIIHVAPWQAAEGLIEGAAKRLAPDGALFIYGPFTCSGEHTAPSNQAFDESLRSRDPAWGVRDISQIEQVAGRHGLQVSKIIDMPANNLTLVLRPVAR